MKSLILVTVLMGSTAFACPSTKSEESSGVRVRCPGVEVSTIVETKVMDYKNENELLRTVRKNVSGSPTSLQAIEGNRLRVIQTPSSVIVVGYFYSEKEIFDALDMVENGFSLNAFFYDTSDLDQEYIAQHLQTIENSDSFPTFMKEVRYLGYVKSKTEFVSENNLDKESLLTFYRGL